MASKGVCDSLKQLKCSLGSNGIVRNTLQNRAPRWSRCFATVTPLPSSASSQSAGEVYTRNLATPTQQWQTPVLTTIYQFPTMEPLRFRQYPANHLGLPLRRDILHRAVIYEGDKTRQGTASTKWRTEVHGSNRKIRPQKGTGMARLGDKKSPMLRGGGVAFGPKPRDFATELPKKIYDLAWRTALSYRYSRGELLIMDNGMDLEYTEPAYVKQIFERHGWGKADRRSLLITRSIQQNLFQALQQVGEDGRALTEKEVDVKDLLEQGRIIIERGALDKILRDHQSDLARTIPTAVK